MAENKVDPIIDDTKVEGKIVSRGAATPVQFNLGGQKKEEDAGSGGAAAGGNENETSQAKAEIEAKELLEKNKLLELSDDQLKELLKGKGIEIDDKGFEGLREKLKPQPAALAPEEIEKKKLADEAAFEKRMLDLYQAGGGKVEDYVALKQIASADLKELSRSEAAREMREAGFSEEQIAAEISVRYYQIKLEELEKGEDETDEDFANRKKFIEKKIAFGSKKLDSKSSYIKKQAEDALSTLRNAIKEQDLQKQEDAKHSQGVEEFFTKLPRKLTFELGKATDGTVLSPFEETVPEEVITEVMSTLKDSEALNKFLYNEDKSLNLTNLSQLMIRNKLLEKALTTAHDKGGTRQVEIFEKMFPGRVAKDIGVGGKTGGTDQKRPGVLVSRGKSEPVARQ